MYRESDWQIMWEPLGEGARLLLDFGDLMDGEIVMPRDASGYTGRSDFAPSAVPVSRGNARRRIEFIRRDEHASNAESWEACSQEIASLPWGTKGVISLRYRGGLERYFVAAVANSTHEPATGGPLAESVHEVSLRVTPLSALILPDGIIVTGGYFVPGGSYHVPQLPPGTSIPDGSGVIVTGTPGVIPGNYTVGGGGVPPGGGGIDVPLAPDEDPVTAPSVTSAPAISGDPVAGGVLAASAGVWSNATAVTRRWFFNNVPTASTGMGFTIPESASEGDTVHVQETAINGSVTVLANSNTITVVEVAPVNTSPPAISGLNTVGALLSVTPGTWTGAATVTRQWLLNGAPVGTELTYTIPVDAVDGDDILCRETATNGIGNATADSNVITVAAVPTNTVPPAISGDAEAGALLTAAPGTWTAAEIVTGEWFFNGAATGDTDLTWGFPAFAVEGDYAFYKEIATNDTGSAEEFSNIITISSPFDTTPVSLPAADLWVLFGGGQWVGRRAMTFAVEFQGLPAGTTLQVNGEAAVPATGTGSTEAETQFRFTVSAFPLDADPADTEDRFRPFLDGQDYTADEATVHATWDDGFVSGEFERENVLSFSLTLRDAANDVIASFTVVPKVSTTCRMRSLAPVLVEQASGRAVRLIDGVGGIELLTPDGFLVL